MHIGIAGTGKIGTAIGKRLLATSHVLTVWNRTPDRTRELVALGAELADSPRELAGKVEAVITMLTDGPALDQVYFGPDGLLCGPVVNQLMNERDFPVPSKPRAVRVAVYGN